MLKLSRPCISLAAAAALVGCATPYDTVKNADDVGQVFVKAFPPIRFEQIQEDLQKVSLPLTADQARAQAIAITSVQNTAQSTNTKAVVQVALPTVQRTGSSTSTSTQNIDTSSEGTIEKTGTNTTATEKKTTTNAPVLKDAPEASLTPVAAASAAVQPSVADARLQQVIAMGLLEENAWLNSRLKHFQPPKGQRAYLLTFQVSVQPNVHGLPVNSVVDISLWPRTKDGITLKNTDQPPLTVYPILLTDNLEASARNARVSRNSEIGANLNGGNIGFLASLGLTHMSNKYAESVGHELNGVSVVGFKNNNHVVVRMGATRSPGTAGGLELTARSHLLSVLVLADRSITELDAISRSHFVDQISGDLVCDGAGDTPAKGAQCALKPETTMATFGVKLNSCLAMQKRTEQDVDAVRDLRALAQNLDFENLNHCLDYDRDIIQPERNRFFAALTGLPVRARMSGHIIRLPDPLPTPTLPAHDRHQGQATVGKTLMKLRVTGGSKMVATRLTATLSPDQKLKLATAAPVTVADDGRTLGAEFALGTLGTKRPSTTQPWTLEVCDLDADSETPAKCLSYQVMSAEEEEPAKADTAKPKANPLKVDAQTLWIGADGQGLLNVRLPEMPSKTKQVALTLSGAEVADVSGGATATGAGVVFTAAGVARLTLRNLVPGLPITLGATLDGAATQGTHTVHPMVNPARAAAK